MTEKKKRRKLYHFENMIKDGINYYMCFPVKHVETKKHGMRYMLTDPLTDELKTKLSKYDNVVIGNAYHKYAPEIKCMYLIILE